MVRGDIYWIKFKQPDKTRPALIITRNSAIPLLTSVTVIPITSTIRDNAASIWLDESDGMPKPCVINVDQIQTISKEKIGAYLTHIEPVKMDEVVEAIKFAFGFEE
ncbi:MAG: type II toxin-antitoxin system PemK/MazF family toxin [Acidobacteria bacterium]|nr:type II toxin-antitoxin system PemK/MazF family toxin [Acidobacteriota bacterium]